MNQWRNWRARRGGVGSEVTICTDMLFVSGTAPSSEMGIQVEALLTNLRKNLNHGIDYCGLIFTLFLFFPFLTKILKTPKALWFCFLQDKQIYYWQFQVLWEIKTPFSRQLYHKDPAAHTGLHLKHEPSVLNSLPPPPPMKPHLPCDWYLTSFVPIWCLISCLSSSDVRCKMFLSSNSFLDGLLPSLIARVSLRRILLAKEPEERRRRVDLVQSCSGYRHKLWVRTFNSSPKQPCSHMQEKNSN